MVHRCNDCSYKNNKALVNGHCPACGSFNIGLCSHTTLQIDALLAGKSELVIQLLQASYNNPPSTKASVFEVPEMIEIINAMPLESQQTLMEALDKQKTTNKVVSQQQSIIIQFCEQLFNQYIQSGPLHREINNALTSLRKSMLTTMLNQQQWPWHGKPNLQASLQLIVQHCTGWHPQLGRASIRFLSQLTTLIKQLAVSDSNTFEQAHNALADFFLTEKNRITKLEKRLHDTEKGLLLAAHTQKITARTINQLMAGNKLPLSISKFLQGPLRDSLQLIVINDGEHSDAYQNVIHLSKSLIWSFQPNDNDEQRQRVYQSISQIAEKLYDSVISLHHDKDLLGIQLSIIEAEHVKVLKGNKLEYQPFDLINNSDPLYNTQTVISNSLLKKVDALNSGQWFHYKDNKPIKLSLKLDDAKQLLFTDFFGVKVQYYSFEEFAYQLSSKTIIPIDQKDHYTLTGEMLVNKLYINYQNKKQQQETLYIQRQTKLKQKLQAQEAARKDALEKAQKIAREQQQARQKYESEAKAAEIERRKLSVIQNQSNKTNTDIKRLNIGAVVEFYNDMGDRQRFKLAVKLQSSGKYIFTDRNGVKCKEKNQSELTSMLLQGSAKIINEGSYFEDSLEKVVSGLRKKRDN